MGHLSTVIRSACALAVVCASARSTHAAPVLITDGTDNVDGHTEVRVDEYGSYGFGLAAQSYDSFQPPGAASAGPTYAGGAYLFVTTPDNVSSSILLSSLNAWHNLTEGTGGSDGLAGGHPSLARTVTAAFTGSGTEFSSAFAVSATGLRIDVGLVQRLTTSFATATSQFDQAYAITNNGSTSVDLVFHAIWEVDLYFSTADAFDDVVGVVPGLCAVYLRNPGSAVEAVALADGGSTVPRTSYFAGKEGTDPGTPYEAITGSAQPIWTNRGMPAAWRDHVAGVGYATVGDSGALTGDATIGSEYRFSLAAGATETIVVRRLYGTAEVACGSVTPPTCGDALVQSPAEVCDSGGDDTATCNGATCTAARCGDGYTNAMAGEACDSTGVDSTDCVGSTCARSVCGDGHANAAAGEACDDGGDSAACNADCLPAMCGDGYLNAAAAEECETGELCDTATCSYTFSLGGGCAGCGAGGGGASSPWLVAGGLLIVRRRRRARAA